MEHITVKELSNGFKKLTPDAGYILKNGNNHYSEAVVKDIKGWSAVPIN